MIVPDSPVHNHRKEGMQMVAPVQKDSLTEWQVGLATYLRITSPIAGMFTGSEIKPNPNARSIRVPDIRVDDYIDRWVS